LFENSLIVRKAAMARPMVSYCRVSTKAQGRSGLGLEAQREAPWAVCRVRGFDIAREFVEVATGKGSDALARRPQFVAALAEAKRRKCRVAVAKPDHLSRDVHFIAGLMAECVQFIVASLAPTLIRSSFTCSVNQLDIPILKYRLGGSPMSGPAIS
jgi:hypothetical protein